MARICQNLIFLLLMFLLSGCTESEQKCRPELDECGIPMLINTGNSPFQHTIDKQFKEPSAKLIRNHKYDGQRKYRTLY